MTATVPATGAEASSDEVVRTSSATSEGTAATRSGAEATRSAEPSATAVPVRAAGIELLGRMPGSGYREAPALVRRADGQTLQLTPMLYALLEQIDGERGHDELADRFSASIGKTASAEDVAFLVEKKLRPLGVLCNEDGDEPVAAKANPLLALRWRVVLSDPAVTRRVTRPFARLFAPLVLVPAVLAFLVCTGWVLFDKGLASATSQAFYQPGLLLTVFALTVVSAGFHEFGHAAACRRGGATPGAMGFGIYVVWPAFYTDVSDSYRLGRGGRLRVDLGGLYFNALFALAAFGLWVATGWDALLLLIGLQVLQMLRQLTPVIRADGYHILADLTGVPDLFAHLAPTVKSLWPGNWRKSGRDGRALKRWARVIVILWVLLIVPSLAFALISGAVLMPRLIATAWDSLGVQAHTARTSAGDGDVWAVLLAGLKMIAVVLPVAGVLALLGRMALRTGKKVRRWTTGSWRRRSVALLAVAALVAGLGWCWWPRDQYQPVVPQERGTLLQLPTLLRAASTGAVVVPRRQVVAPVRMSALLLVPRDAGRDALLLLRPTPDAPPRIVAVPRSAPTAAPPTGTPFAGPTPGATVGSADPSTPPSAAPSSGPGGSSPSPWPFPFSPPERLAGGDNQAYAVNTTDGTALYDVAFAVVWVNGSDVLQRNDAVAVADCTGCRTVAVAFQAVFIIGQSDTVIPVNTSLAVNYDCVQCRTSAIAVQLVATLTAVPDPATMAELDQLWRQLDVLATEIPTLTDQQVRDRLRALETAVLRTLAAAGGSVAQGADAAAADGPAPAPTPSAALGGAVAPGSTAPPSAVPTGSATGGTAATPGVTGPSSADASSTGATTGTAPTSSGEPSSGSSAGTTTGATDPSGDTSSSTGATAPTPAPAGAPVAAEPATSTAPATTTS